MSVDLPAPFSPNRPWISPGRTSKLTPFKARTPGKLLEIPSSLSMLNQLASAMEIHDPRRSVSRSVREVDLERGGIVSRSHSSRYQHIVRTIGNDVLFHIHVRMRNRGRHVTERQHDVAVDRIGAGDRGAAQHLQRDA